MPDVISTDEVDQLKEIWDELAVGVSGYLDIQELSIVCEHIGMENIEEQVCDCSSLILKSSQ